MGGGKKGKGGKGGFIDESTLENWMFKINSKLGGLHTGIDNWPAVIKEKPTMIIGLDCDRPTVCPRMANYASNSHYRDW